MGVLWQDCAFELVYFLRGVRHFWDDPHEDRFELIDAPTCPYYGCKPRWTAATSIKRSHTELTLTAPGRLIVARLPAIAEPLRFSEICSPEGRRFVVFFNHSDSAQHGLFGYIEVPGDATPASTAPSLR